MENSKIHLNLDPWHLGWRAKIGLIMPAYEEGLSSYEYRTIFPEGVIPLETRVMCHLVTKEELIKRREEVLHAAEILAVAAVDVIVYVGTGGSYVWGVEGAQTIVKEIEDKTGIKATIGGLSVSEALKFLGIKKMIFWAPYNEEVTKMGIKFFEDQGISVPASEHLGLIRTHDIYRIPPWEAYRSIVSLYRRCPDVDGIFLSGGGLRTLQIIETLEKDTGLPVVGTTNSNAWRSLQLAGIREPIYGFGKLLSMQR